MQKNILITGAAKRIGRAIALKLAENGWNIAIHYNRSQSAALELADQIQSLGSKTITVQADLSDPAAVRHLFSESIEQLGPLTGLINNASLFEKDTLSDFTEKSFRTHMDINLLAPALLTQCMAAQKQTDTPFDACIVNIIDQRVHNLRPDFMSYTLSKSAFWTLTQTSAMALAPHIRVNAIGPGPILPSKRQTDDQFSRQVAQVPLGRSASTENIAEGVLFLLTASSITGEFISMDGGQHLPSSQMTEEE